MKRTVLFAFPVFAFILLANISCQKRTECKATVHCVDSTGTSLKNTNVVLYAKVKEGVYTYTADVKASGTTDEDGVVRFTFKLPAIFDIKATSVAPSKTVTGTGIIKLEEGQGSEKIITLK